MGQSTELVNRAAYRYHGPVLRTYPGSLFRVTQQVHSALWRAALAGRVTSVQYGCLLVIDNEPNLDQLTLGARMSLDKVTVADVVRRIVRSGLAERTRSMEDRRRSVIQLSAIGRVRTREWLPLVNDVQKELFAPLSVRQREALTEQLRLVVGPIDDGGDVLLGHNMTLYTSPGHLIRRAQQRHASLWHEGVGPLATSVQYAVLLTLDSGPPMSQASLGSLVSLDKSTCSDVISRLHRRDLVTRTPSSRDGRQNLIGVTPAGRDLVKSLEPVVRDVQAALLDPLTARQRNDLVNLLGSVVGNATGP